MSVMKLDHAVEDGVTAANVKGRLDARAALGWKIMFIVPSGANFLLAWQKTVYV
jgi:hypothetical protein